MTATDELRRLLDERGVEWADDGYATTCTVWAANGIVWHGLWRNDCIELIAHLTPQQAIDATLGRGECRVLEGARWEGKPDEPHEDATGYDEFYMVAGYCTGCGEYVPKWRYCPNCGRRVIS